eukprot:3222090-Rhodomonas_salina.1
MILVYVPILRYNSTCQSDDQAHSPRSTNGGLWDYQERGQPPMYAPQAASFQVQLYPEIA